MLGFFVIAFGIGLAIILTIAWMVCFALYAVFFHLRLWWRRRRAKRLSEPLPCLPANDDATL